jgi:hypothetical protein
MMMVLLEWLVVTSIEHRITTLLHQSSWVLPSVIIFQNRSCKELDIHNLE